MRYLDVGGGLAIDYDGSASEAHTSRAYTLESYATAVVGAIAEVCCLRNIPAPTIVSESGRALASHHSVVIFDVVNHNRQQSTGVAKEVPSGTSTGGVHIGGGHNGGAIPRRPLTELSSFGSVIPFGSSPPGGVCSPTAGGTVPLRTSSGVISPLASASVASSGVLHSPLQRFSLGCAVPDVLGTAENRHPATTSKAAIMLRMLRETLDSMTPGDALSLDHAVHDAEYFKGESLRAFKQGAVGLEERAAVDALVDEIKHKAAELGQMGGGGQRPHVTTLHINLSGESSLIILPKRSLPALNLFHSNLLKF